MSVAGVLLYIDPAGKSRKGSKKPQLSQALLRRVQASLAAGLDEVIVVLEDEELASSLPGATTVLLDGSGLGPCRALRSAVDYSARSGHEALLVSSTEGEADEEALASALSWRALAHARQGVLVGAMRRGKRIGLVRLDASIWPVVPLEGSLGAFYEAQSQNFALVEVELSETKSSNEVSSGFAQPDPADVEAVAELLGRQPMGAFRVALRDRAGVPLVIENAPVLEDRTPMPTRFWLVGKRATLAVARLESTGGVKAAESAVDPAALADSHRRYAEARDELLDPDYEGPRPSGGVGGTRRGVKCLHAHLAWYLVGGKDPVGRYVIDQIGAEIDGPVAAIDCGTNSTCLLVLSADHQVLERQMRITRLGEGVDETHALTPGAIERTLEVLRAYRERCDELGVVRLRASATSAARDASNSAELFDPARDVLGVELELLAGTEEGRLSYLGATAGLPGGPYLVCDLGGGSTELIAGSDDPSLSPAAVVSMNLGCVRVTERFLHSDPPQADELTSARAFVRGVLEDTLAKYPALSAAPEMIGVAGTVAQLATLKIGLEQYSSEAVNGTHLSIEEVNVLCTELARLEVAKRRERRGVEEGRADVIVGGALVLAEVMSAAGHDELVYSEADILDGMAYELLERGPAPA